MSQNHSRSMRIVLVESGARGELLQKIFQSLGTLEYILYHARNVDEVIALSAENECDIILLDHTQNQNGDLTSLERLREAFAHIPMIVFLEQENTLLRDKFLRSGSDAVMVTSHFDSQIFLNSLRATIEQRKNEVAGHQEQLLVQALSVLQKHPIISREDISYTQPIKPLCEAMPIKFLELSKSYSNLLDLALTRAGNGVRFKGHSVSQKLHFLASDLSSLRANVWDVIDIHTKAIEDKAITKNDTQNTTHKILLELISDLVSSYRQSDYVNS